MAALWTYAGIDGGAVPLDRNIDIGVCAIELHQSLLALLFFRFFLEEVGDAFKSSCLGLCQHRGVVGPLFVLEGFHYRDRLYVGWGWRDDI